MFLYKFVLHFSWAEVFGACIIMETIDQIISSIIYNNVIGGKKKAYPYHDQALENMRISLTAKTLPLNWYCERH